MSPRHACHPNHVARRPPSNLPAVTAPTVVILAAGQGTRMRSRTPKMLHDLCGRPMVAWPIAAALEAGAGTVVVVGGTDGALDGQLPEGVELAIQPRPDGTGGAVLAASDHLDTDAPVLVLNGDVPLVTAAALRELVDEHVESRSVATLATMALDDPSGYGRVVRGADGAVQRVVETKHPGDATDEELAIPEVNAGIYVFDGRALLDALRRAGTDNAQGEIYLPDAVAILRGGGWHVAAHPVADAGLLLGVNDRVELARVRALAQTRIQEAHMRAGVTIVNPASTQIDVDVRIGADTVIEPFTTLHWQLAVGEVQYPEQLRDVDVLGGQAAAQHVI